MEHKLTLNTEQVRYLLGMINHVVNHIFEEGDDADSDSGDELLYEIQEILEDAEEDSWFVPGGSIYEMCKKKGTL